MGLKKMNKSLRVALRKEGREARKTGVHSLIQDAGYTPEEFRKMSKSRKNRIFSEAVQREYKMKFRLKRKSKPWYKKITLKKVAPIVGNTLIGIVPGGREILSIKDSFDKKRKDIKRKFKKATDPLKRDLKSAERNFNNAMGFTGKASKESPDAGIDFADVPIANNESSPKSESKKKLIKWGLGLFGLSKILS